MHNSSVFAPMLLASLAFFVWSCYRRFSLVTLGKEEDRFDAVWERLLEMFRYAFGQKRVVAKPFGVNHLIIFWSFIILLIANGEFLVNGVLPGISLKLLPAPIHHGLLLAFDLVSLATILCILLSVARRLIVRPACLDSRYVSGRGGDAFLIIAFIAILMLAYLGLHGAEIAMGKEEAASAMPVSSLVARLLAGSGNLAAIAAFCWWVHALVLLAFICYLPHSKHMHILTAIPNCFFKSLEQPNTQPREEFAKGNSYGVSRVDDLTWKDLFDTFSCTECGRCQESCPAHVTGKPLNPRQIIHAIKTNLLANSDLLKEGKAPELPLIGPEGEGTNTEDAIWACTTCGACLNACPVFIEQMSKIVKMRRYLVQMEARFPEELLNLFENMEQRANPWGIAPSERTKWCSQLDIQPFEQGKTEYLLFVGCSGAFDSRQKLVTVSLASILDAAGVSWGILGKEEKCCGDSLRRLGNEYVFDKLATENVQLFKDRGVTKVITQCPHCFSTLKNDYRQYGLNIDVIHHTELIDDLLRQGKLKLDRKVESLGSMVFHDSCYLGRHNGIYEQPRAVIAEATGTQPGELTRNRENSFCCGAGGGRMWMEEHIGSRINHERVNEALQAKPDTICVACPYCMTMFEDGIKDAGASAVRVKDVAEVVAEAMRKDISFRQ